MEKTGPFRKGNHIRLVFQGNNMTDSNALSPATLESPLRETRSANVSICTVPRRESRPVIHFTNAARVLLIEELANAAA